MPHAVQDITIVGASLAGLRGGEALRRADFDGPIRLIGAEQGLPYDRPPLSKQVLAGDWEADRIELSSEQRLTELAIEYSPGVVATGFDLATRRLSLDGAVDREVDGLMISTGARVRTLAQFEGIDGVHTLRTRDESLSLAAALDRGPCRVVVIGAGFIGAEVAATVRGRGIDVTLVETLDYPMARVLGPEIGGLCGELQRDHGVDLRCGISVTEIVGEQRVEGVQFSDGGEIAADLVVVGIGVVPNTEWLEGSGLDLDDGVVCDATCLAAPRVTAAGDVARWFNSRFDESMRVEHWDNAVEQSGVAARRLLLDAAQAPEYRPVPWFWSDQYDRKIQMAGRPRLDDETFLVSGSLAERRFASIFGRDGKLTGVFAMNRPRHVMQFRMRIEEGMSWDQAIALAD
ncbi:MAG: FAD-dependent oxidoreductase [Acidimicrobiales bacterium]